MICLEPYHNIFVFPDFTHIAGEKVSKIESKLSKRDVWKILNYMIINIIIINASNINNNIKLLRSHNTILTT